MLPFRHLFLRNAKHFICPYKSISFNLRCYTMTAVADLRKGDFIDYNGKTMIVQSQSSTHQGRASRTFSLTMRESGTETMTTIKPSSKDTFYKLDLLDRQLTFAYSTDSSLVFVDLESLNEVPISIHMFKAEGAIKMLGYLEPGHVIRVKFRQDDIGKVVSVLAPHTLLCTVHEILEVKEGQDRRHCVVKVEGGGRVTSNLILSKGEVISVDLAEGTSLGRVTSNGNQVNMID